jgi:hypothetical protein
MQLIFFDESKNGPDYSHYHIGAACVSEEHLMEVEKRVSAIAQKAFGTTGMSRATELHAAHIYQRMGNFKGCADFERRLALISDFLEILSMESVQLINIQINCDLLHAAQDPDEIAFMFLCERANDLMRAQKSLGMLIGDRENDRVADRFSKTLSGYRAKGTDFAFGREINNLVDSVHFTHSHLSRFIQLADVYTWILQFRNRQRGSKEYRPRAVFNLLEKKELNLFPKKYKIWPSQD